MKPVALVERAIRNSSKSREVASLDPTAGATKTSLRSARMSPRAAEE
jgi:hypothetical protein